MERVSVIALTLWLCINPKRAAAADEAMPLVPLDIAICLGIVGLFVGALIMLCITGRKPPRLPSAAFFHDDDRDQAVPFWSEWTPKHGEWAAHLNASRRQN